MGVDWAKVVGASAAPQLASLPTYAFQRQRYWLEAEGLNPADAKNGVQDRFWKAVQSGSMEQIEKLLQLSESPQREHLSALLPALSNWYAQTEAEVTVDGWCYEDQWQRVSASALSAVTDGVSPTDAGGLCWLVSGHWLDVVHLERLRETFRALGTVVECLTVNEAAARLQADAGSAEGHAFLPRALVYLAGGLPPGSSVTKEKPWLRATSEAVMLAQGISRRTDGSGTRLWLCTPHALRIRDDDVPTAPYLQALWGLGRTLNLELLNRFGGLADLGSADDLTLRRMAVTFLSAETHSAGEEFALRGHRTVDAKAVPCAAADGLGACCKEMGPARDGTHHRRHWSAGIVAVPLDGGARRAAPHPDVAAWRICAWSGRFGGGTRRQRVSRGGEGV